MNWFRLSVCWLIGLASAVAVLAGPARPNIIFIIADDLGYGDLGSYGQKKIRTPNLDRLTSEGMRFTAHYAGNNVCAPARCVLLSGKHPGHAYIRDNREQRPEGQQPVPAGELVLPLTLRRLGYANGGFGKWGLGPVGSEGDPGKQGFDRFFGYNCQRVAHNHYPTHLWDNDRRVTLNNPEFSAYHRLPADARVEDPATYAAFAGRDYAPDLIAERARAFVREHRDRPFFLYYPTTVPHLALQVPEDSLAEYAGAFPEEPYRGDRGYLPHRAPRAAYAAMITRMDRDIGRLLTLVDELGLRENTIVVFTSDNGPLYDRLGGTDTDFFDSAGGFRGRKGAFHEGGFRVPCLVRWPGRIAAGTVSDRVTGFEDWLPTLLELTGNRREIPEATDGISFAPTLLGKRQRARPFLYRETTGYGGQQCVRAGDWKVIRRNLKPGPNAKNQEPAPVELYHLGRDPGETDNLAAANPRVVRRLNRIMAREHTPSPLWPMPVLDRAH